LGIRELTSEQRNQGENSSRHWHSGNQSHLQQPFQVRGNKPLNQANIALLPQGGFAASELAVLYLRAGAKSLV
jgi:hypothetical protein